MSYSGTETVLMDFAESRGIPISETPVGQGRMTQYYPNNLSPVGVVGSSSTNAFAEVADVVIPVGMRLQDIITGSWTVFAEDAQFLSTNAASFDAVKHLAVRVIGGARKCLSGIEAGLGNWRVGLKPHGTRGRVLCHMEPNR